MIQAIKEAIISYLTPMTLPGGLCFGLHTITDSQVDTQPSGNSPILQIHFLSESPPTLIQGYGDPKQFDQQVNMVLLLRSTQPEPDASRNLYRLWMQRQNGNLVGVKIALNGLVAVGLLVGVDVYRVGMGEIRMGPTPQRNYTSTLEIPMMFVHCFSG